MSQTPVAASVAHFFDTLGAFLVRGEGDVDAALATLGPSRSGRARVALYRELVDAQHHRALESSFPRLRRALEARCAGSFAALATRYLVEHRCHAPHPGALGALLPAFVEREAADAALDIPGWAAELADLERLTFELACSPLRFDPEHDRLNVVHATRLYRHDVVRFARTPSTPAPERRDTAVIVFRHPRTHHVRYFTAGPSHLVVLGLETGELDASASERIASDDLDRAAASLRLAGVLGVRTRRDA